MYHYNVMNSPCPTSSFVKYTFKKFLLFLPGRDLEFLSSLGFFFGAQCSTFILFSVAGRQSQSLPCETRADIDRQ